MVGISFLHLREEENKEFPEQQSCFTWKNSPSLSGSFRWFLVAEQRFFLQVSVNHVVTNITLLPTDMKGSHER